MTIEWKRQKSPEKNVKVHQNNTAHEPQITSIHQKYLRLFYVLKLSFYILVVALTTCSYIIFYCEFFILFFFLLYSLIRGKFFNVQSDSRRNATRLLRGSNLNIVNSVFVFLRTEQNCRYKTTWTGLDFLHHLPFCSCRLPFILYSSYFGSSSLPYLSFYRLSFSCPHISHFIILSLVMSSCVHFLHSSSTFIRQFLCSFLFNLFIFLLFLLLLTLFPLLLFY